MINQKISFILIIFYFLIIYFLIKNIYSGDYILKIAKKDPYFNLLSHLFIPAIINLVILKNLALVDYVSCLDYNDDEELYWVSSKSEQINLWFTLPMEVSLEWKQLYYGEDYLLPVDDRGSVISASPTTIKSEESKSVISTTIESEESKSVISTTPEREERETIISASTSTIKSEESESIDDRSVISTSPTTPESDSVFDVYDQSSELGKEEKEIDNGISYTNEIEGYWILLYEEYKAKLISYKELKIEKAEVAEQIVNYYKMDYELFFYNLEESQEKLDRIKEIEEIGLKMASQYPKGSTERMEVLLIMAKNDLRENLENRTLLSSMKRYYSLLAIIEKNN